MSKTPLALAKEQFKDKQSLLKAVRDLAKGDLWLDRESASGLDRAPNSKLLRLHASLTSAKKEYGSRAKIVDAIVEAEGRQKDKDYRNRFEEWSVPRLVDHLKAAQKRSQPKAAPAKSAKRAAPAKTARKSAQA